MPTKKPSPQSQSGLILVWSYLALFIVNVVVVYIASVIFPLYVALGTFSLTTGWSLVHSMGTLALLNVFAIPFVREYEHRSGTMVSNRQWLLLYFVINFVGIWVISRFADQVGFGISSWLVAAVLAVVLNILQAVVMMSIERMRTK